MNLSERREYPNEYLHRSSLKEDPFEQFQLWFDDATKTCQHEPNAMTLATATKDGRPSSRTVLLKELDDRGFVFYTNYRSRKAQEIAENPLGSLTFVWLEFPRQVLVEGEIKKVTREESQAYFSTRPRKSQIAALASEQGVVLGSQEDLQKEFEQAEKKYESREIPLPEDWGGYRLCPMAIEFWQGRRDRLHDRFLYRREGDVWVIERLSP
ncbi:MAG: Pyridoxine/pyridoxamine 5'-phosphate oxidase [Chlamydiae bacterium]|nr:Pyridoxine/pyridoxamine 5'-phosphate oxidase [Chlamydiota bacterium]